MNKKKFNETIDDVIDRLVFNCDSFVGYNGVCHAILLQHFKNKLTWDEHWKLKYLFSNLMCPISEGLNSGYFLGKVCEENVAYRTYMLEWFRYFVNEYKMYEAL